MLVIRNSNLISVQSWPYLKPLGVGVGVGVRVVVGMCRLDTDALPLHYAMISFILQPYSRLDTK